MKKFFINAIKIVIAFFVIMGISFIFSGIEIIILKVLGYIKNIDYISKIIVGDVIFKWFVSICIIIATVSIAKGITIIYLENKQLKGVYKLLARWRKERNITHSNYYTYCGNIIEELLEPLYEKETVKLIKEEILKKYFVEMNNLDEDKVVDTICDVQVFSINELGTMKYNNKKCMIETIKEISSRKQDPQQKIEWTNTKPTGKWKKWEDQPKDTLYAANYSICKR